MRRRPADRAEYWAFSDDPAVVLITECDDPAAIMEATAAWDDVFEFTIVPVITAEEGIRAAKAGMAQAAALAR